MTDTKKANKRVINRRRTTSQRSCFSGSRSPCERLHTSIAGADGDVVWIGAGFASRSPAKLSQLLRIAFRIMPSTMRRHAFRITRHFRCAVSRVRGFCSRRAGTEDSRRSPHIRPTNATAIRGQLRRYREVLHVPDQTQYPPLCQWWRIASGAL